MPLTDVVPFGAGLASADSYLAPDGARHAALGDGDVLAAGLFDIVDRCRSWADHPALDRPDVFEGVDLWPVPHDRRFDFPATAAGAEWIDDAVRAAQAVLVDPAGDRVVAHTDWRAEHVHLDAAGRIVATYDWDSVRALPEPMAVAVAAATFTADWTVDRRQIATLDETLAFVAAYERARGAPFDDDERRTCRAAIQRSLAYGARCEWSDKAKRLLDLGDVWDTPLRSWLASPQAI